MLTSLNSKKTLLLDPCAGGDKHHPMPYPTALYQRYGTGLSIDTIDIRQDSRAQRQANYLKLNITTPPQVIITNPPFCLALPMIEKALFDVADAGYVIMLLRLNFLEGKSRKSFFEKYMPTRIYVHHQRMSFTDNGKTDSVAYCHMVWQKDNYKDHAELKII